MWVYFVRDHPLFNDPSAALTDIVVSVPRFGDLVSLKTLLSLFLSKSSKKILKNPCQIFEVSYSTVPQVHALELNLGKLIFINANQKESLARFGN